MKFLLDNNVTKKAQQLLISMGHDVTNLRMLGVESIWNGEVYMKACELGRMLITYDEDFLNIGRLDNPSIIYIKVERRIDENVVPRIRHLINNFDQKYEMDYLITLDNDTENYEKFIR